MNQSYLGAEIRIPIRLEDADGNDVLLATASVIDVYFALESGGAFGTALTPTTDYTLQEQGKGQYTLKINKSKSTKAENYQVVVEADSGCSSGIIEKRYSGHIVANMDIYFKSTGSDTTGDGTITNPYQSIGQCLTRINNVQGYTIHCLDSPANVAGNKDQSINEGVTIKGHGYSWTSPVPTLYHISVNTNAKNVILEDLNDIKINLDSSSYNTVMRRCLNVSYISRFSEAGVFEDCIFSASITGGGTDFGKRAKWLRCVFKENVDVNISQDGGIFKDCVFEKNLDTGVAQYTVYDNCVIHGVLTGENNTAFNGQVVFKNPYINNNAVLNGKKYIVIGGVIRGALTFEVNSVDCVVWGTRVKGGVTDSGTGNEILNEASFKADVSGLALEATAQAIKAKTDNLPADPASESSLASTHGSGSWETSEVTIRANSRLKEIFYDDYGNPTHYLEYIYANATDAEADQNPTKILDVTSTYAQDAENENRWQLTGRLIKDVTP